MTEPVPTIRVPLGVWVSMAGLAVVIILNIVYMARTFGSLETTLQQHDRTIQSFQNSTTQEKLNDLAVELAGVKATAAANASEIRSIQWRLNRGDTRSIPPRPNP